MSKPIPNASDNTNEDKIDEVANGTPISTSDDWTWKTTALLEVWNNEEESEYFYHDAVYEDTIL